jgi:RHS repeat-associated protein
VLTNGSGAIVWRADYSPYGKAQPSIETAENPFRFPGQYYDAETGLHYNYHRYYQPETGRYITPDPIGLAGGINLYGYVGGNAVNKIDVWGLYSFDDLMLDAGNLAAGFGDEITVGGTAWIRRQLAVDNAVDKCSGLYRGGKYAGDAWWLAFSSATAARAAGWTSKIAVHGPHHEFRELGTLSHIQTTIWKIGESGSGKNFRIPLPWK